MSVMDALEDAWDLLVDGAEYLFSFEWFGDAFEGVGEFFSSMFEGLGEFSFLGLTFAILAVLFSYCTRYINIDGSGMGTIEVMTNAMPMPDRLIWVVICYVGTFIAGYMMGKYFENT